MSARVCDRCHYTIVSQVVTACPNCGAPLPARAKPATGPIMTVISFVFLALLGWGGITIMRQGARWAEEQRTTTLPAVIPSMRPVPAAPTSAAPAATANASALLAALASPDAARRSEAAQKLAEEGGRNAVGPLLRALKDSDPTVRQLSTYALARMSERGALPPAERPNAAAAVRPLLRDPYDLARSTAAYAIGVFGDRRAVPALLGALNDPSPSVRAMTATALGTLKEARAVKPLIPLLSDETTVWAAAHALGEIGNDEASEVLMTAYNTERWDVVAGAHAYFLRRRTPGYEKVLLELLQSRNDLAIAQTLILSGDPRLAGPARKWATDRGFTLRKDAKSPTGVTWVPAGGDS
jgi:HEAT repeat protein